MRAAPGAFDIYRISLSFYALQLVIPSVVAIAVRKEIAICKIVFQVFAFIFLNVKCLMLNVNFCGLRESVRCYGEARVR
jgi:hypothetical protein